MDRDKLAKKGWGRVLASPTGIPAGAAAAGLSLAVANPLPVIIWAAVFGGRFIFGNPVQKAVKKVMAEEQEVQRKLADESHARLHGQIEIMLGASPFVDWIRSGVLPDYSSMYQQLGSIREEAVRVAHERSEIENKIESDIVSQLDQLLVAFLRLLKSRLFYLQILSGVQMDEQVARNLRPTKPKPRPKQKGFARVLAEQLMLLKVSDDEEEDEAVVAEEAPRYSRRATPRTIPTIDVRVAEYEQKIVRLEIDKREKPAAARVLEEHVKILGKRIALLRECHERDVRVAAQLDAFVDTFGAILDRLNASQFSAAEVTTYMQGVVEQVEETEAFAEAMRPAMDAVLGDLPLMTLTT